MKELVLKVTTKSEDVASQIIKDLKKYNCDYNLVKENVRTNGLYEYKNNMPTKLCEDDVVSKNDKNANMKYYRSVGKILLLYGIPSHQLGFKYLIECVRLMNSFGMDNYSLRNDVYPLVAEWYDVSETSIEHNIRNSINYAWDLFMKGDVINNDMKYFRNKPTNLKFLRHIAKITSINIADSY